MHLPQAPSGALGAFVNRWKNCQMCLLSQKRFKTVLYRGVLPCEVLFVGEAPGYSEDAIGSPFVGEAGRLFNKLLAEVVKEVDPMPTYAVTNVVCCLPEITWDDIKAQRFPPETNLGLREPAKNEALACRPRLEEFVHYLAKPKLIIRLGKVAKRYVNFPGIPTQDLIHPSGILHKEGTVAQRVEFDRSVRRLVKWMSNL